MNNGPNLIQVAAPTGRQVNDLMLATLTIGALRRSRHRPAG